MAEDTSDKPRSVSARESNFAVYMRGFDRWHITVLAAAFIVALALVISSTVKAGGEKEVAITQQKSELIRTCGALAQRVACVNDLANTLKGLDK
jgi:hypothetical protein